jgi:hypothetical protein
MGQSITENIEEQVALSIQLEKSLEDMQNELMQNEQFRRFLELQKTVPQQIADAWRKIEEQMIANDVKSIKGDWGSITVAERINWTYDPLQLPAKFFKKVVDSKKLTDTFRLEGKAPKGAEPNYTKYLMKRIK